MSEISTTHPATAAPGTRFCSQCGATLATGARFCSGCGRSLTAGDVPPAPPARTWREQLPGLAVLTAFLAAGLAVWVSILRPGPPSATAPPTPPGAVANDLPADHPPLGLPEEATRFIAQLTEKAEAAPSDVGAWRSLAQVQARAAELDPSFAAKAAASYRHVLQLAPDDRDAIRGLANALYDQRDYASAAAQYERYLTLVPDDPNVRTDLATTYLYLDQADRAIEAYLAVVKDRPDFLQAHFNLGLAYESKGEREKALAALARARALASDDATRTRIDRVTAQLGGEGAAAPAGGPAPAGEPAAASAPVRDAPPGDAPGPGEAAAPPPSGTDFKSSVEAGLRAHEILGPKITGIEWPEPTRARVLVADFPMSAMPDFARNLFRGRLETILFDAKESHGESGPRTIELVDAASGTTMETVTQ